MNPYQNYLKKKRVPLNMTINGNNNNTPNILNTAKCNTFIYLGGIITFKCIFDYKASCHNKMHCIARHGRIVLKPNSNFI